MSRIIPTLILLAAALSACAQPKSPAAEAGAPVITRLPAVGGPCEFCEEIYDLAESPDWTDTLPGYYEPGEQMVISGTIYQPDGRTPAPGVILYVYQTNAEGIYPKRPGQDDGPHGYIRGWMRTDAQGRYRFLTIRPGSYPNSRNPQHVHAILYEPGKGHYWIDDYLFADDPLLTGQQPRREPRGSDGVISLKKNDQDVWTGQRDIVLGRNVPGW